MTLLAHRHMNCRLGETGSDDKHSSEVREPYSVPLAKTITLQRQLIKAYFQGRESMKYACRVKGWRMRVSNHTGLLGNSLMQICLISLFSSSKSMKGS